ncbi:MAG TPA: Do family serine endopeptidase [Chitinispirillaceae bacterium]|nr:Do family serine endopeptidase [Chitinispirillaceae bacterium]
MKLLPNKLPFTIILNILLIIVTNCSYGDPKEERPRRGSISIGASKRPIALDSVKLDLFKNIFVKVAQSVVPSVVAVIPTKIDSETTANPFANSNKPKTPEHQRRTQALGSGVIVTSNGYLLTNYHVISGAEEIDISLSDGRIFKASVAGTDSLSDVAVLKIKGKIPNDLPLAYLGNSDSLKPGDWVAAIGNPFSLKSTITQGIISALEREIGEIAMYQNFIQTDAAINPGNSGGALVNIYGEVIGINSLIYSQDGGFMGIGFAIPINMAKKVMEDLVYEGRVVRGWIGLSIQELTNETSRALGIQDVNGVLVSNVYESQPASQAGIQRGDIIISLNNQIVKNGNDLRNIVASIKPGTTVPVTILRQGKKIHLQLKVIERTPEALQTTNPTKTADKYGKPRFDGTQTRTGIAITNLNDEIRNQYKISTGNKGVVVTWIDPTITDARTRLVPGDLIMQIKIQDKKPRQINDVHEFVAISETLSVGQSVLLLVRRSDTSFYVPFEFHNP